MSTDTNREASRRNPCKKQASPFFSHSRKVSVRAKQDHNHETVSNSNDNILLNSKVTLCSHLNPKIIQENHKANDNQQSKITRFLQTQRKPVMSAHLPATSTSMKTQRKMSDYFRQIANNPFMSHQIRQQEKILPSQKLFRLQATISKSDAYKSPQVPSIDHDHSELSHTLDSSNFQKPLQSKPSASLSISDSIATSVKSIKLCEKSSHHDLSQSSTEKIMELDEFQYSVEETQEDSSSTDVSSTHSEYETESILRPQEIRRSARISLRLIPSQVSIHQRPSQEVQHPSPVLQKEQKEKLQNLYKALAESNKRFEDLQKEYNNRKSYIDSKIEELSDDTEGQQPKEDEPQVIFCAQQSISPQGEFKPTRSNSSVSSVCPTEKLQVISKSTPHDLNQIKRTSERVDSKFRYLNYAGNSDDATFKSSCTSSVSSGTSISTTSSIAKDSKLPDDWYDDSYDESSQQSISNSNNVEAVQGVRTQFRNLQFWSSCSDASSQRFNSSSEQEVFFSSSTRDTASEGPVTQVEPTFEETKLPAEVQDPRQILPSLQYSVFTQATDVREAAEVDPYTPVEISPSDEGSITSVVLESEDEPPSEEDTSVNSVILNAPTPTSPNLVTPSALTHEWSTIKGKSSIRLIGQNCNGIYHKGEAPSLHFIPSMESMQMMGADLVLLSETNTDWKINENYYETKLRNKAIWRPSPTLTTVVSCPWDNIRKTSYQPGGLMTLCTNDIPSRIKKTYRDPLGRFIKTVIQGKTNDIAIYNVYRPNHMSLNRAGIDTIWMQQWVQLKSKHEECDPRRICIEELITHIQKGHEDNELPILMGDLNEDLHEDSGFGLKDLLRTTHMVQIYQTMHGAIPSSRNNSRSVYHVLVSKHLVKSVDRIGVLSKKEGFHTSDHVPFFLDLNKAILDGPCSPIVPNSFRKLKLHDADSVERYNCYVKDQFDDHNIIQRVLNLKTYVKLNSLDAVATQELEKLDEQITDIRLRAENRLIPDPSKFKHTSKMSLQVTKIRAMQIILRSFKKKEDITPRIEKYIRELRICPNAISTENLAKEEIARMKETLKLMQEAEDVMREDHLEECLEKAVAVEDKAKTRIIKEMKEREKQQRSWDKIHFVTKTKTYNQIDRLGIPEGFENKPTKAIWEYLSNPNAAPKWTFITHPEEIERRLLEWQIFHYSQASETPLAKEEWYNVLDPKAKTDEEVRDIFQTGKEIQSMKESLPKETQLFIKHLLSNVQPTMESESIKITTETFQNFYKKVKEKTSSSPSQLHLGHWKAASRDKNISMVLANIIEIAVSNEYTLHRWRKVVSVLMEKISGSPVIHKFRTIHLIESDLNFVMRLVWGRNFMRHNEKNKSWHPNQYGGRKGHQGQSAALNKILTMDIIRHYAEPAALIDNDAQACYDRLIPVVLSYSLIRLGLPIHLTRFMCRWLERAEYYLKLGKGISKHAYKNTLETYLYGSGQGTGWSPPNWGSISDILSTAMSENTPGMYLSHPNNKVFSNRSYDAFVDDVNGGVTSEGMKAYHPDSDLSVPLMETIFEQIEANVEYYSRLLFSSGGRLALHKCYCYILEFEWKNGIKKLRKTADKYDPLQIDQQSNNKKVPIKLLNPNQARKMLGSISAPDGSSTDQVKSLVEKAKKWGDKVQHGYLNRYDVSISMRQGLLKSLEYPLGVSLISEQECDSIMIPAMSSFLRKLGFNKNTARRVVYGPHCYGGLQLPNLYTSQGIQKLQLFLGHSRKNDTTGKILSIAQACAQQEVGISQPILMTPMSKWGHLLSQSWIKCLWGFLSTISGKIRQTNVWTPPKCYEHDVNIMEQVRKWGMSQAEEKTINLCRIYMRVSFIGELYDTSRVRIKANVAKFEPGFHNNKYPKVQLPKRYSEIWQNALQRLKQETPLGDRLGKVTSTDSFEWRTSDNNEYLFRYSSNRRTGTYERVYHSTSIVFSQNVCQVETPPPPIYVVTIQEVGNLFHASHPLSIPAPTVLKLFQSVDTDKRHQFYTNLHSKETVYVRTVGQIHEMGNLQAIASAIKNSTALGVGDASVARDLGGHAYVIETQPAKHRIHGTAPVDCLVEDLTSNRGESSTVLAMLIVTSIICDIFHIMEGSISIMCDNKEALRRRKIATSTYTNLATRDMDIKMEVEHLLSILPITVSFHHVPGHSDDDPDFDYDRAPQRIQRNVDMHYSVTSFMKYQPSSWAPTNITPFFPRQQAALLINDYVISGDIKNHVMMQKHGFPMEFRLREKFKVENRFLHIIDWRSFKLAYSGLDLSYKTSATKIIHKLWPTSSSAAICTDGKSPMCMRCSLAPETVDHVYRCTHRQAQSSFREAILTFKKDLKKIKTAIPLQNMFVEFLLAFKTNRQPSLIPHTFGDKKKHDLIRRAYVHQLLLGQNIFHLGYISYKWGIVYKAYSNNDKKGTHHISWASKVIKAIWSFSQRIWRQRCSWIHQKQSGIDESLYTEELKSTIKEYLKLPRNLLSKRERALHINVSRHLRVAYSTTLARWLRLLANERAETIRSKRNDRIANGGLQPLTNFFRWRTSVTEGNFRA